MIDIDDLQRRIEPILDHIAQPSEPSDLAICSIAVSLKRIADTLEILDRNLGSGGYAIRVLEP